MADIFLIVSITVAFFILFVVAVYLLVYYQHPDDHNEAYFPKFVVIIGIVLAGATALLLPLDVANGDGYAGTCILVCRKCTEVYVKSTRRTT
jgi:LMBR1 domain-containing protein 1